MNHTQMDSEALLDALIAGIGDVLVHSAYRAELLRRLGAGPPHGRKAWVITTAGGMSYVIGAESLEAALAVYRRPRLDGGKRLDPIDITTYEDYEVLGL